MIHQIRYYGDPVLRKPAAAVTAFDENLELLAADMIETMYHYSGVGLAAPQIGLSKRIYVAAEIDPSRREDDETKGQATVREELAGEDQTAQAPPPETPDEKRQAWGVIAEHVMINPVVLERSGVQYGQDGCLSVPGLFVEQLQRDARLLIEYRDVHGHRREREAEGHFAHVLQHELDHLDGVLFLDRLEAAERKAFMEAHRSELADIQRRAKAVLRQLKAEPTLQDVR